MIGSFQGRQVVGVLGTRLFCDATGRSRLAAAGGTSRAAAPKQVPRAVGTDDPARREDVTTLGTFKAQRAPCGRIVKGASYRDADLEAVVTQAIDYACGCRSIDHEYHDGSISRKVIRHDGKVLVDELLGKE
jgi:hypothetical protein